MLSVKQKIAIARMLNRTLRIIRRAGGLSMKTVCHRRGIEWNLDLDEGIDLAIYLLGAYEAKTLAAYRSKLKPGAVVFDIGANVGAHTLHFAKLVGASGHVHAFEPTDFACAKLRANLALNPTLGPRVTVNQAFLVGKQQEPIPAEVCSSWPVDSVEREVDAGHLGQRKSISHAESLTTDEYIRRTRLDRLDFIKIDVDGHEPTVLEGCRETLRRFRPLILIELAPFIYADAWVFDDMVRSLAANDYIFYDANTRQIIPSDPARLRASIRAGASRNALLHPSAQ